MRELYYHPNAVNRDIKIGQMDLACSWDVDPADFEITLDARINLTFKIWVHAAGDPTAPIVETSYKLVGVALDVAYNEASKSMKWVADKSVSPDKDPDIWSAGAEALVIGLGFGGIDDFKEKFYYGFSWVTGRSLVSTLISSLPFPQLQKTFDILRPVPPFLFEVVQGYAAIWTEKAEAPIDRCGSMESSSPEDPVGVKPEKEPPGDLCDWEEVRAGYLFYFPLKTLAARFSSELSVATKTEFSWSFLNVGCGAETTTKPKFHVLVVRPEASGGRMEFQVNLEHSGTLYASMQILCGPTLEYKTGYEGTGFYTDKKQINADQNSKCVILEIHGETNLLTLTASDMAWPLNECVGALGKFLAESGAVEIGANYDRNSGRVLLNFQQMVGKRERIVARRRMTSQSLLIGVDMAPMDG
ncbi:MAG: hypothetical protein QM755_02690 [Luteolibacter sp.]